MTMTVRCRSCTKPWCYSHQTTCPLVHQGPATNVRLTSENHGQLGVFMRRTEHLAAWTENSR
jgi:hypothetical protein